MRRPETHKTGHLHTVKTSTPHLTPHQWRYLWSQHLQVIDRETNRDSHTKYEQRTRHHQTFQKNQHHLKEKNNSTNEHFFQETGSEKNISK